MSQLQAHTSREKVKLTFSSTLTRLAVLLIPSPQVLSSSLWHPPLPLLDI